MNASFRFLCMILWIVCFVPLLHGQQSISGNISLDGDGLIPIQNVPVMLGGDEQQVVYTDAEGNYEFSVATGGFYTITPYYNSDLINGVSTLDIVLLVQHAEGINLFTTPYEYIAADLNNSQSVDLVDTVLLRNAVLGVIEEFPNNTSWRFVDASFDFPDPTNPWLTPFPESIQINNLTTDLDGQDFIGVKIGDLNWSNTAILSLDPCEIACGHVFGKVFYDLNQDCVYDGGDTSLENWIISVTGTNDFFTTSNALGQYRIPMIPGNYTLEIFPPNDLWAPCQASYDITIEASDSLQFDFPVQAATECPLMSVDIGTSFLRRCFSSTYTIQYCNMGTLDATDVSMDITFDDYLTVLSSEIPWDSQNDNTYTFSLPDLEIGACQDFQVIVEVSCDAVLGQTHCTEAHVFPDSLCLPAPDLWDGADLEVNGDCEGDSVYFDVINIGDPMQESVQLIVIEDHMIMREETIQLGSNENLKLTLPKNGSTWRLEVAQTTNHPESELISATLEACGVNAQGNFSLGYVSQFPFYPGGSAIDIDCTENIGAYDPNDKQALPRGFGEAHWIEQNVDLEYHIRFQNTGTDTAFNVVIRDTISPWLDLQSIVPGVSSHDYRFNLLGNNVIEFSFPNIMLPDSNINEAASHGFVKFNIAQQKDNPIGTLIENSAGIYFDFNEPIITNVVYHEVGEDFIGIVSSTRQLSTPKLTIKVFPNPVKASTLLQLEGPPIYNARFKLYDPLGRLVREQSISGDRFEFDKGALNSGLYYFEIEQLGQVLGTGKLMVL
ncbi:MAG: T9SS type A sorting domain-containing protein [Bacteroidota bacterium]